MVSIETEKYIQENYSDKLKTVNNFISDTDNFKFSGEFEVYNMITEKPFYDIWTSEMANEIIDYYLNNC